MKVQYISDIHTEFMSAELQIPRVVRNIREAVPDADTIVLAGDIGGYYKALRLETFLNLLCPLYGNVIYVLGNHEYYTNNPEKHTITKIQKYYRELENTHPNLTVLIDEDVLIEGKVFAGSTLWFDVEDPFAVTRRDYMNDFKRIPGGAVAMQTMAAASLDYINSLLLGGPGRIDLLITHHGVARVFHDKYKTDANNVFFYQDISRAIEWLDVGRIIHGHQHSNFSYELPCMNAQQVVTVSNNCKGYPDEHPDGFSYGAYVEI